MPGAHARRKPHTLDRCRRISVDKRFGNRPTLEISRLRSYSDQKWRVVKEQGRRPRPVPIQHPRKMLEAFLAKAALVALRTHRIGDDQPNVEFLDRVLHEWHTAVEIFSVGECPDHRLPMVTVAGQHKVGNRQPIQQVSCQSIFLSQPIMGDIASMDDDVRLRFESIDISDAGFEFLGSARLIMRDVTVGNLDDSH